MRCAPFLLLFCLSWPAFCVDSNSQIPDLNKFYALGTSPDGSLSFLECHRMALELRTHLVAEPTLDIYYFYEVSRAMELASFLRSGQPEQVPLIAESWVEHYVVPVQGAAFEKGAVSLLNGRKKTVEAKLLASAEGDVAEMKPVNGRPDTKDQALVALTIYNLSIGLAVKCSLASQIAGEPFIEKLKRVASPFEKEYFALNGTMTGKTAGRLVRVKEILDGYPLNKARLLMGYTAFAPLP